MAVPVSGPTAPREECVCSADIVIVRGKGSFVRRTFTEQPCDIVIEFMKQFSSKNTVGSFSIKCPTLEMQNSHEISPKHAAAFLSYFQGCDEKGVTPVHSETYWEESKSSTRSSRKRTG